MALQLTLLGGFAIRRSPGPAVAVPRKKAQALLAYLALHPSESHPRDRLAALLWGDASDERARQSLRQSLSALRRVLGEAQAHRLCAGGETVALEPGVLEVDVLAFERLVAEGTPEALERATELYRGDFLEGLGVRETPFEEWLVIERERLRELALEALAKLLAHWTKAGLIEPAIQTAGRLLGLDPLQEPAHRALMRLYVRQERRGAALHQYQFCAEVLERELGVEPEPETKHLYEEILLSRPVAPPRGSRAALASGDVTARPLDRPTARTTLFGREAERAGLRQATDAAWRGRGQVAVVLGEAGVGKSRLVQELVSDALARGGRALLGRAYESEQVLPFGPWLDAFRTPQVAAEIRERDDLDPKHHAALARLLPELGGRAPAGPTDDPIPIFEAVGEVMRALATRQPLLVVIEDVHWADKMSLRLLAYLGRRLSAWRALLVATAREEELGDAAGARGILQQLDHEPHARRIMLAPLPRPATLDLVRALVRTGTEEETLRQLGERVWEMSEGNPFVVVEALRTLHEGDTNGPPERLPLPQRVRHIITGRLERLTPRARQIASVASVIGREFDFALLEHAVGLEARETAMGVQELVSRRVLHAVGEQLDFVHDRIREVAHDRVLDDHRKAYHGAVGRALEEMYARNLEPHALAIGRHYHQSETWERAHVYLRQAGLAAAARSAHREAVACFEQALEAIGRLSPSPGLIEQAVDLRFDIRQSCAPLGDIERTVAHLREAEAAARDIDDQRRLGWVFAYRTNQLAWLGDHRTAIDSGLRARAIAETLDDPNLREVTNCYLGLTCFLGGDPRRGAEFVRENVERLEQEVERRRGDLFQPVFSGRPGAAQDHRVFSRTWLAWCLAETGAFAEGVARGEEAVRLAEAHDNAYELGHGCLGVAYVYVRIGAVDRAVATGERGLELCQGRDFPQLWLPLTSILGYAYAVSGRVADGIQLLERAAGVADEGMGGVTVLLVFLSEAYLFAGRLDDASAVARRALALADERSERGWRGWALRLVAEIAARREPPEPETAERAYREAAARAAELGMRPLLAHCHLGLARLDARAGTSGRARDHFTIATTLFREMETPFWLEKVEAEMAQLGLNR